MNATIIGYRIKQARDDADLTLEHLAAALELHKSTVQRYESGQVKKIKLPILESMAKLLNVNPDWLACKTDVKTEYKDSGSENDITYTPNPTTDYVTFPVIGEIAAGFDHLVLENWNGATIDIPTSYLKGRKKEDFIVLEVIGDSMFPEYREGDIVCILKQPEPDYSGQVGAIIYNDNHATLKKVEYNKKENWMHLVPINPNHKTEEITGENLNHCTFLGIPKLLVRDIKK